jgi:hypothetical protein
MPVQASASASASGYYLSCNSSHFAAKNHHVVIHILHPEDGKETNACAALFLSFPITSYGIAHFLLMQ